MDRLSRRFDPDLIFVLVLLACGLIAYSNSFTSTFHFDDIVHILENDALHDLANIGRIYSYCNERFLTYLTLAFNYRTSGFDPVGYHVVNFFIHYFSAFFLYFLFIEIWKTPAMRGKDLGVSKNLGAFLAAGIFFLHPLQTQAVTYIVQRAECMAGMFYLATLYFYVKARLARTRTGSWGYAVLVVLAAFCAAFSKETAVTLPALIVVFEVFFFNTSIKDLARKKMFLVILVPAGIMVAYKLGPLVRRDFFWDPGIPFTRKQYILTQFSVLVTYLRLFFWPANQNVDWDYPLSADFFSLETFSSFLFLLTLFMLGVFAYRKFRLVSLGIIGFFITLAPTSSIIPIKDVIFEHRMYLAVAFLAMGGVQLLFYGLARVRAISYRSPRVVLSALIITLLPLLIGLTHARNEVWLTGLSLWKDAVQKSPNKARPHNNYGRALFLLGQKMSEDAKREFETANRLAPDWALPYHNLAIGYFREGDFQRAIALDLEAIKRKRNYKEALYLLARSHKGLNQWQNARLYLERLMNLSPDSRFLRAYLDLLDVYLEMGLQDEAFNVAEALTRMPDILPNVDYFRGMAFYRLEDFARAKYYFTKQAEQKSSRASSFLMLGQIHYLAEEYEEAETAFRRVLEEQMWSPAANYNLAIVLEKSNRFREAGEHFEKTLWVDTFSLAPRLHLIKLYDHLGDSSKKLQHIRKLFGLRPDSEKFLFLKENEEEDLTRILCIYEDKFLAEDDSLLSEKARAIIATLRGDYHEAIQRYESYLLNLTNSKKDRRIEEEVLRLEGILQGKEPLRIPA